MCLFFGLHIKKLERSEVQFKAPIYSAAVVDLPALQVWLKEDVIAGQIRTPGEPNETHRPEVFRGRHVNSHAP